MPMLGIFEKLKRKLVFKEWILIESHTGVWNLNHGGGGLVQTFLFYNIEFCPQLNAYRLVTIGENAAKHRIYGDMLSRLAKFNTGKADEEFSNYKQPKKEVSNEVRIVSIPLKNKPEEVWDVATDEKVLIDAMNKHVEELKKDGIEIFEQRHNIVATDVGYFAAVWLKDINFKAPDGEQNTEKDEE